MRHRLAGGALAILVAGAVFSSALGAAHAADIRVGSLKIENAFTRPTPGGAAVAAGYLTIVNGGNTPDRLVSVTSDISAKAQIHEMKMDNGVMEMREVPDGLPIPAGASVMLKPGGYHIMFVDLKRPVKPGDVIHVVLTFEKAGKVDVPFPAAGEMGAMSPGSTMGGMKMQ
jgi:periplasmic copper chaperone A